MERLIPLVENGVRTKIPVHQALVRSIIAVGLKGNYKASQSVLREYQALLTLLQPQAPQEYIVSFEAPESNIPVGHERSSYGKQEDS